MIGVAALITNRIRQFWTGIDDSFVTWVVRGIKCRSATSRTCWRSILWCTCNQMNGFNPGVPSDYDYLWRLGFIGPAVRAVSPVKPPQSLVRN
jgi:hypothetical protein